RRRGGASPSASRRRTCSTAARPSSGRSSPPGRGVLQGSGMLPEATGEAMPRAGARRWLINGFPALRHRNFRLFVAGQGVSLIGTWMQSVAQSWLVYRLSGSRFALGLVAFAGYLPILCLAPAAGVVADRVDRQRLIILTQALAMLLALALGVLVAARAVSVPAAVLAALLSMRLERLRRSGEAPAPVLAGFLSGLDYVRREPALRNLLVLLGVVSGLGLQYAILIPVFAKEIFHAGATGYGLLVTAA